MAGQVGGASSQALTADGIPSSASEVALSSEATTKAHPTNQSIWPTRREPPIMAMAVVVEWEINRRGSAEQRLQEQSHEATL